MKHLKALIVESSLAYADTCKNSLLAMGLRIENIFFTRKYTEAKKFIEIEKPHIILTEFKIEGQMGLELIQKMTQQDANKISVIITHNNSSSAIAEAAEELVDDYIIKPFTSIQITERLMGLIRRKLNPPEYIRDIRAGKQMLLENRLADTEVQFTQATQKSDKPSLAYYYLGYTKFIRQDFEPAVDEFKRGLYVQPLHFKCLTGKFDTFFEQKNYAEAYKLAPTLLANYPIGPKRLANLFIAAVYSGHLEEVPQYYDLFLRIDQPTMELRRVFSAALLAAGKFHLKQGEVEKAVRAFEFGVQVAGADISYIDKVARSLLQIKPHGYAYAAKFIQKFPAEEIGGKAHSALSFLVDQHLKPTQQIIEQGRKLVSRGYADAECYRQLTRILVNDQKITLAEDIIEKAVRDYPELRQDLYGLLETNKDTSIL